MQEIRLKMDKSPVFNIKWVYDEYAKDAKDFLPFLVRQVLKTPSELTMMCNEAFLKKINMSDLIPELDTKSCFDKIDDT